MAHIKDPQQNERKKSENRERKRYVSKLSFGNAEETWNSKNNQNSGKKTGSKN